MDQYAVNKDLSLWCCRQEKAQGEEMAEAGRASLSGKNGNTSGGFGKNTNARNLNVSGAWITPSGTPLHTPE